ncbi:hypothetical protein DPMN_094866, partial [Dreissena polymorpha]
KLVSDGASYYSSQEFQHFLAEWDINHVQSSPHYPSNYKQANYQYYNHPQFLQNQNHLLAELISQCTPHDTVAR